MKKSGLLPLKHVLIVRASTFCLLLLVQGCCSMKHLDREDFLKVARRIGSPPSTVQYAEYIGATQGRVYIQSWDAFRFFSPEIMVYWTERNGLPSEVVKAIEAGQPPWIVEKIGH